MPAHDVQSVDVNCMQALFVDIIIQTGTSLTLTVSMFGGVYTASFKWL